MILLGVISTALAGVAPYTSNSAQPAEGTLMAMVTEPEPPHGSDKPTQGGDPISPRGTGQLPDGRSGGKEESAGKYEEIRETLAKLNVAIDHLNEAENKSSSHEKDWWDKFDLVTKFVATVLLVMAGGVFTYFYKSAQDAREANLRVQQDRVNKLDVVSKFMPFISSEREDVRRTAIFVVQDLVGTETAVKLAITTVSPDTPATLQTLSERAAGSDRAVATTALNQVVQSGDFIVLDSLFVTDRNVIDGAPGRYGTDRADLSFGTATISIPKDHRLGSLESPSALRLEFREDPTKHIVVASARTLSEPAFSEAVTQRLASSQGDGVLIFVHGYNTSFSYAARSFAQSFFDLNLHVVPILYSWPSRGSVTGYLQDEETVVWTAAHLSKVLIQIKKAVGDVKLSLIADGVGCRAALDAIQTLATNAGPSPTGPFFDQLILTAPDVDEASFSAQAPLMATVARRVTRYVSSQDTAMQASAKLHGGRRAGDPSSPSVPGIETVDVSDAAHGYFAASGSAGAVLRDMYGLLRGEPATRRSGLIQTGPETWKLK